MVIESFDFVNNKGDKQERQAPQVQYEKHTDYRVPPKQHKPAGTLPQIDINEDEIPFSRG
jgi:hypothetical protein